MSPMKTLASLTLPINCMVAFGLEGGGFGMMSIGWDLVPALVQPPCSVQSRRRSCYVSPSGSLKALNFECSDTDDPYAPTLGNCSTESCFDHSPFWSALGVSCCITALTTALPLGPLTTSAGTLNIPPLTPIGTLLLGFSMHFELLLQLPSAAVAFQHILTRDPV